MTRYLVQPTDRIFAKGCRFFTFSENMDKNIDQNLSSKYSQKPLDQAKKSLTYALKTALKRAIQKLPEATGDLISNKYISPKERQKINEDLRLI